MQAQARATMVWVQYAPDPCPILLQRLFLAAGSRWPGHCCSSRFWKKPRPTQNPAVRVQLGERVQLSESQKRRSSKSATAAPLRDNAAQMAILKDNEPLPSRPPLNRALFASLAAAATQGAAQVMQTSASENRCPRQRLGISPCRKSAAGSRAKGGKRNPRHEPWSGQAEALEVRRR